MPHGCSLLVCQLSQQVFPDWSIETDKEINKPSSELKKDRSSGELSQDLFEAVRLICGVRGRRWALCVQ